MGKGDKKTRRGKIFAGSYGVSRRARKKKLATDLAKRREQSANINIVKPVAPPVPSAQVETLEKAAAVIKTQVKTPKSAVSKKKRAVKAVSKKPTPKKTSVKKKKAVKKPAGKKK